MFFEFLYVVFNVFFQTAFIHGLCQICLNFKKKKFTILGSTHGFSFIFKPGAAVFNSFWFKKNISILTNCNSSDPIGQFDSIDHLNLLLWYGSNGGWCAWLV